MGKGLGVVLKYKPQKFFISYICGGGGGEREREREMIGEEYIRM